MPVIKSHHHPQIDRSGAQLDHSGVPNQRSPRQGPPLGLRYDRLTAAVGAGTVHSKTARPSPAQHSRARTQYGIHADTIHTGQTRTTSAGERRSFGDILSRLARLRWILSSLIECGQRMNSVNACSLLARDIRDSAIPGKSSILSRSFRQGAARSSSCQNALVFFGRTRARRAACLCMGGRRLIGDHLCFMQLPCLLSPSQGYIPAMGRGEVPYRAAWAPNGNAEPTTPQSR